MPTIEHDRIRLSLSADAMDVSLLDRVRKVNWQIDGARRTLEQHGAAAPLPAGRVEKGGGALTATHDLPDGRIILRWELARDHVRVRLSGAGDHVESVDLPGVFRPATGSAQLLLPPYQGVLYRGGLDPWEETRPGGAHGNFSLSMAATLAPRGALLATAEDLADWVCRFGEDLAGPFCTFRAQRCPADGWYDREVRLYPVAGDVTAIAKQYRARLKERGEFVPWAEKLARKPVLENLFGALMAFIGYNKSAELDYADCARQLRDRGFERVLYYPVRMCNYSLDFLMGGDPPIWLSDEELRRLKAVPGALVAPWGWYVEGLDDGSERMARLFRRNADGSTINGWRIENQQWKIICIPYQVEESARRFAGDMREMDWVHYDVNATRLGRQPCFSAAHDLHGGKPLGRRGDVEWTRRLLGPETNGNRIVSSEGFVDRYAVSYDIGAGKLLPAWGHSRFIPVPLTMLVLHDSCVHDWWELHNYNETPGFGIKANRFGETGNGRAAKKAAMDALYGCPPNVFPFGRQYGWVDIGTKRTFSYLVKLEDREVQRALELALPVSRLHRRIGQQELVGFEFLSDDLALQATTFADGTRVVANLGHRTREHASVGAVPPDRWVVGP